MSVRERAQEFKLYETKYDEISLKSVLRNKICYTKIFINMQLRLFDDYEKACESVEISFVLKVLKHGVGECLFRSNKLD